MALKTTLERLEAVQAEIEEAQSSIASYTVGDVKVSRKDASQLEALYEQEKYLMAMYKRENHNVGRIRINLSGRPR